ncbi:MAG: hypothetical protein JST82_01110 [Bacteroidetes bacterium]|nr:hypothetical protein [Bacteroidota bacterium]
MGEKNITITDCNSPVDQMAVANYHSITQAAFEGYLYNYWGESYAEVAPVSVPWTELSDQMAGSDCSTTCWKLEYDFAMADVNAIALGFQELSPTGKPPEPYDPNITYYAFALFNGAYLKDNATEFQFFKAQYSPPESKYAVIFRTMNGNTPVGYYNLSDSYPIQLP